MIYERFKTLEQEVMLMNFMYLHPVFYHVWSVLACISLLWYG